MNAKERRKSQRVNYRTKMFLQDLGGKIFIEFISNNISGSGIFIQSENIIFKSSEPFVISFYLPNKKNEISTRVRVIFTVTNPMNDPSIIPGIGMTFVDISDSDREALEEFINSQNSI